MTTTTISATCPEFEAIIAAYFAELDAAEMADRIAARVVAGEDPDSAIRAEQGRSPQQDAVRRAIR